MIPIFFAAAALAIIFAFLAVVNKDLFVSALFLCTSSLFLALTFFILRAPDIAITEAAVGAALSTFLLIMAINQTERGE